MTSLAEQMSFYAAYHANRWNKLFHFAGVPSITFSLLLLFSLLRLPVGGFDLTAAQLFVLVVAAWYVRLDLPLAAAVLTPIVPLLLLADRLALRPGREVAVLFGLFFVGGWIFQLAGHAIEGRRPALVDNFLQVFVAPLFLAAEALFALGFRKKLERQVIALRDARLAAGTGAVPGC